jgi:hypothetical protein
MKRGQSPKKKIMKLNTSKHVRIKNIKKEVDVYLTNRLFVH